MCIYRMPLILPLINMVRAVPNISGSIWSLEASNQSAVREPMEAPNIQIGVGLQNPLGPVLVRGLHLKEPYELLDQGIRGLGD